MTMNQICIKDIYAGKPDARDEIDDNPEGFFDNFIVPNEFPVDSFFSGSKFLVSGYKGVGKTSVLYYLQNQALKKDGNTCTSFIYFKSDLEEVRKSTLEAAAKKLTAYIDISGDIQPDKVEYLHIWRWLLFRHVVDDVEENENGLFEENETWYEFVEQVNKIQFKTNKKREISLASLGLTVKVPIGVATAEATATLEKESAPNDKFLEFIDAVDECEKLFKKLKRTDIPYYIFVDEIEAFYGNQEMFKRDLTLIRDLIFTMNRLNKYGKVKIIGAIRNEILFAMDRFITTNELNKITDGYKVPIHWSYSNTNSTNHPIIEILMKRISVSQGSPAKFEDWFPETINGKDTVSYILENGWNKPRDIVRLIIAAQNDNVRCRDTCFSQASFDSLRKEYSKNSLTEVRQELQSLYSIEEIEMVFQLLRGGERFVTPASIRKKAAKGSRAREFWDNHYESILEDFYRVGFWGNVKRNEQTTWSWRWNHKSDIGVLTGDGWELAIHPALCSELSIRF